MAVTRSLGLTPDNNRESVPKIWRQNALCSRFSYRSRQQCLCVADCAVRHCAWVCGPGLRRRTLPDGHQQREPRRAQCRLAGKRNSLRSCLPQQNNTIEIVVDGATAERADEAASALAATLAKNHLRFISVRRPDGGPFFAQEGLLLLPLSSVQQTTDALIKAQPFLGGLAVDPSLRGIMKTLDTTLLGVSSGQTTLANLDRPITAFAKTIGDVLASKPAFFGWTAMVGGASICRARGASSRCNPSWTTCADAGTRASKAIRIAARKLGLKPAERRACAAHRHGSDGR